MNKLSIPSFSSAALAGGFGIPFFILGLDFIRERTDSNLLLVIWSIIGFILPFLISTTDIGDLKGRLFRFEFTSKDFKEIYLPTWKRMMVWFISACASTILLQLVGVNIVG